MGQGQSGANSGSRHDHVFHCAALGELASMVKLLNTGQTQITARLNGFPYPLPPLSPIRSPLAATNLGEIPVGPNAFFEAEKTYREDLQRELNSLFAGATLLHVAALYRQRNIMYWLLTEPEATKHGLINMRDDAGRTALHHLVVGNYPQLYGELPPRYYHCFPHKVSIMHDAQRMCFPRYDLTYPFATMPELQARTQELRQIVEEERRIKRLQRPQPQPYPGYDITGATEKEWLVLQNKLIDEKMKKALAAEKNDPSFSSSSSSSSYSSSSSWRGGLSRNKKYVAGWQGLPYEQQIAVVKTMKMFLKCHATYKIEGLAMPATQTDARTLFHLLLKYEPLVNIKDGRGWKALAWAVFRQHTEMVSTLLAEGSTVNDYRDLEANTLLHTSCLAMLSVEILTLVLMAEPEALHFKNRYGLTPLHCCLRFLNMSPDVDGIKPYHARQADAVLCLLSAFHDRPNIRPANPFLADAQGRTPLHSAACAMNPEACRALLEASQRAGGPDRAAEYCAQKDATGSTALHLVFAMWRDLVLCLKAANEKSNVDDEELPPEVNTEERDSNNACARIDRAMSNDSEASRGSYSLKLLSAVFHKESLRMWLLPYALIPTTTPRLLQIDVLCTVEERMLATLFTLLQYTSPATPTPGGGIFAQWDAQGASILHLCGEAVSAGLYAMQHHGLHSYGALTECVRMLMAAGCSPNIVNSKGNTVGELLELYGKTLVVVGNNQESYSEMEEVEEDDKLKFLEGLPASINYKRQHEEAKEGKQGNSQGNLRSRENRDLRISQHNSRNQSQRGSRSQITPHHQFHELLCLLDPAASEPGGRFSHQQVLGHLSPGREKSPIHNPESVDVIALHERGDSVSSETTKTVIPVYDVEF